MKTKDIVKSAVETKKTTSLKDLIQQSTHELGRALPSHLSPERMVRIALTQIRLVPKLAQCTPESFLGALFVLAQVGLEPVAGRSYLIPFGNEVQAVIGYRGLVDLFYRHEAALSIEMREVKENDDFNYEYGTTSFIKHKPAMTNRGETIGYYSVAHIKGGGVVFKFMSKDEITKHAKQHSKAYLSNSSPWKSDFDAMGKKTVLIQLSKMLPLSVELQKAISVDETSRDYRKGIDSALDLPDKTKWDAPEAEVETKEEPKQTEMPKRKEDAPTPGDNSETGTVVGVIEDVEVFSMSKEKSKSGKAWTKYGIELDNGIKYSTFDKQLGDFAQKCKGTECEIAYSFDGNYYTPTNITPMS